MRIWKSVPQFQTNQQAAEFADFLINVGDGKLTTHPELGTNMIQLPNELCINGDDPRELLYETYGLPQSWTAESISNKAILCSRNSDVDYINASALELFPGEIRVYRSVDSLHEPGENAGLYPVEFLNSITPSGLPHKALLSCSFATSTLLLDLLMEHVSQLFACSFSLECHKINGSHAGNTVLIPRIALMSTESELPFTVKRLQFPIRLAFAMTINKSQGQSLHSVGIYLKNPVFSHGQLLYVAFSRTSSFTAIKVMGATKRGNKYYTVNIVYKEILK
jgi:ATP-dependent DNA helicase PIF1